MRLILVLGLLLTTCQANAADGEPARRVVVVRGASGTSEYGRMFDAWSKQWSDAAAAGKADIIRIGPLEDSVAALPQNVSKTQLQDAISGFADRSGVSGSELWIVLLGHGTFDGLTARFNLEGTDVSADELGRWLDPVKCPTAVINCSSASGPFLQRLAASNRTVITATKSGAEVNFTRFGQYISEAIGDASFDLDKDGQTSLFEAYLSAGRRTEQFYESEGRLTTEHALLDDNGDGRGVRYDWFRGIRLIKNSQDGTAIDGAQAHQLHLVRSQAEQQLDPQVRAERDRLEQAVIELRSRKASFASEDEYYLELERLLVLLAEVFEASERGD
ncbi:MAG: hypothetical protein KDA96_11430 [Planctomycetaceae bacterium]|nr:hypothetical protein [Planctomycetaceae bacterium]